MLKRTHRPEVASLDRRQSSQVMLRLSGSCRVVLLAALLQTTSVSVGAESYHCALDAISGHEDQAYTAWSVIELLADSGQLKRTRDPKQLVLYVARIDNANNGDWKFYYHSNLEGAGEEGMLKIATDEPNPRLAVRELLRDLDSSIEYTEPEIESIVSTATVVFNRNVFTTDGPSIVNDLERFAIVRTPPAVEALFRFGLAKNELQFQRVRRPKKKEKDEESGDGCVDATGKVKKACLEPTPEASGGS